MKLKIKVTKEILKASMYCGTEYCETSVAQNCAIALAVKEIFPDAWVKTNSIDFIKNDIYQASIPLPINAQNFILEFDRMKNYPKERLAMDEIEFKVTLTNKVLELINIDEAKEALKKSSTLELID